MPFVLVGGLNMLQLEERLISKLINLRKMKSRETQKSYDIEFTRCSRRTDIFKKRTI